MNRLISSTAKMPRGPRSGTFMIVAMVCLVLTTALLGTLLKMAFLSRQNAKMEATGLQAEWLAESALDRAAAKLKADADYKGETWEIPAEELDGRHAGRVVISLKSADNQRLLEVVAQYPTEGAQSAKRTRRIPLGDSAPEAAQATGMAPAVAEKRER